MKKTIDEFKNSEFAKIDLLDKFNKLNTSDQGLILEALNAIDDFEVVASSSDYELDEESGDKWYSKESEAADKLITIISKMADDQCVPYRYCSVLKSYSHPVYPGEKDSFGWLTACMSMRDGEFNLF